MVITDFSGDYVSAKSVSDGDVITILNEGKLEFSDALKKETFNLQVEINGKHKIWSPSNKHGKILQQAFGVDSKNWVGKKVIVALIEEQMLIKPVTADKV